MIDLDLHNVKTESEGEEDDHDSVGPVRLGVSVGLLTSQSWPVISPSLLGNDQEILQTLHSLVISSFTTIITSVVGSVVDQERD